MHVVELDDAGSCVPAHCLCPAYRAGQGSAGLLPLQPTVAPPHSSTGYEYPRISLQRMHAHSTHRNERACEVLDLHIPCRPQQRKHHALSPRRHARTPVRRHGPQLLQQPTNQQRLRDHQRRLRAAACLAGMRASGDQEGRNGP